MEKRKPTRNIVKVTTIEMDALDDERVKLLQNHLSRELGIGGVPMRAAITWALKVACEKIESAVEA